MIMDFFSAQIEQKQISRFVPANRILIKSNGCKMSVDVTPPEKPATKCSYRMVENRVVFRVEPFVFIAAIVFYVFCVFSSASSFSLFQLPVDWFLCLFI